MSDGIVTGTRACPACNGRGGWPCYDECPDDKCKPCEGCDGMGEIRCVEIGPGNPVKEVWFYADGSLTIGDVQFGKQIGSGVHLYPENAEGLRRALLERGEVTPSPVNQAGTRQGEATAEFAAAAPRERLPR